MLAPRRVAGAALGEQAVEQEQERLVRGRAVARLGVWRVARCVQPARVLPRLESDQPWLVTVPEQAGAAGAGYQHRAGELESAVARRADRYRDDDWAAVGAGEPGEVVRRLRQPAACARDVDTRASAVLR